MKLLLSIFVTTLLINTAFPQVSENQNNNKLSGSIIDAHTGEALAGANILIKNTSSGTAADINGKFTLTGLPSGEFEITVSMVGYKPENIFISGEHLKKETLEIKLVSSLIELGTIVVTGTNTNHLYEDVPVKTEIVTKKLMQQQAACNLAGALGLQTGVMVENNCNNCNFTQVRILGFDGKYSQILIDGDPVMSSLGGVYGLEHYPQEMIEQIEIVKGGGSSLYGGGAIAGTVNMMTRRPAFNQTRVGYSASSTGNSFDQQVGAVAEIVNENNTAGLFIFGSTRNRTPYDHNGDSFSELGMMKHESLGINSYFRPLQNGELKISFHRIVEERRGGNDFDKPVHEAEIAEWTNHSKWGGKIRWEHQLSQKLNYRFHYAFSLLERDSYYGGLSGDTPEEKLQALNYYGYSENPLHTYGVLVNYFTGSHNLTAGMQQIYDKLLDKSVSSAAYYLNENYDNIGFYIQDEFTTGPADNLNIVIGARTDKHSSLENWIISPRLNAKYQLFESLKIRAGYTTGFKAPQTFDEDLHICGLEGTQKVIRNAEGLKEERSSTYSAGFEFIDFVGEVPVLIGVTSFYTKLVNAYTDEFISSEGSIEFWNRINSSGAVVKGIEFDLGIKPISSLEFRSGVTFKQNNFEEPHADFNTTKFLRTPDVFGYMRATYDFNPGFSLFAALKYTGSMYVPHEVIVDYQDDPLLLLKKTSEFFELDLALSKTISLFSGFKSGISIGVKNVLNAYQKDLDYGPQRDPGYVYGTSQPRTYYINFNVNI